MFEHRLLNFLRFVYMLICAVSLPFGMYYFARSGHTINESILVVAMMTIFLIWGMIFIIVAQETFPTKLWYASTVVITALLEIGLTAFTHPDNWLRATYTWLLASFISMLFSGIFLFFFVFPKNSTEKTKLPWWAYCIASGLIIFLTLFLFFFAQPFIANLRSGELVIPLLLLSAQVITIFTPAFRLMVPKPTDAIGSTHWTETWRAIVVITTILTVFISAAIVALVR